jgi:regulator of sigma E protease
MSWLTPILDNAPYLALLAVGFGFVVFWHELGHFLAAKWAGVKVEQFAVGFMQAVVSFRKGLGVRFGSSQKEFKAKQEAWLGDTAARQADGNADRLKGDAADGWTDADYAMAAKALNISETEYRLNWLPLGGYVKMLGQDDLRPNSEADDPRAYNRQTIGKRMIIVSAGVIMNVILAAIGFVILFSIGFHVAPAKVGGVMAGSPAQIAGFRTGEPIVSINGNLTNDDETKVKLGFALSASGEEIPVVVRRDGKDVELKVTPVKKGGFVLIGILPHMDLLGVKLDKDTEALFAGNALDREHPDSKLVRPGDAITKVNGRTVGQGDYAIFDEAVQRGEKVTLEIRHADGTTGTVQFTPSFAPGFYEDPAKPETALNFGGMVPRVQIVQIPEGSPMEGKAQVGDVLTSIGTGNAQDPRPNPGTQAIRKAAAAAADANTTLTFTVLRNGKSETFGDIKPVKIDRDTYGAKVGLGSDQTTPTVAEVLPGSAAATAKVPPGATIVKVADKAVTSWNEVHRALRDLAKGQDAPLHVAIVYRNEAGEEKPPVTLELSKEEVRQINQLQYTHHLFLRQSETVRIAHGFGDAISQGVVETRDFILQFYLTLRRMISRDVDATNLMGPVGIFQAGTHFARKGPDWLIWFLAMISANLAVVNFLPIPIVDGGLFVFLIAEKIKGRPISSRTQAIAQYVGLVLLLSIFLFVTWQDIANFQFRH